MKKLVSIIVVLAAAAALLTGAALAAQKNDRPWIGDDGAVDTAKMSGAQRVVDSTGTVVGVVRTEDVFGDDEVYPHPVYSLDDHDVQVGWLGQHGYWAIGQPKAWCTDCVSGVESIGPNGERHLVVDTYNEDRTISRTTSVTDADGNTTTTVEIIEEGTDGEEGPTGNTGG